MSHGDHFDVHDHPHQGDERPERAEGDPAGGPRTWRSLESRDASAEELKALVREFPDGADVLELDPVSRRSFLGLMGASLALAGVSAGCSAARKPAREILPWSKRPEDLIPGDPVFYATAMSLGASAYGLLVESQDGRPTKIEGNPRHPMSRGGTNAWVQASVLELYDPDRSRTPWNGAQESTWEAMHAALSPRFDALRAAGGAGLAVLVDASVSPTRDRLLAALPQARVYRHDETLPAGELEASAALGLGAVRTVPVLEAADVIVSLDADFAGAGNDAVAHARGWADRRRSTKPGDRMNRLYVIEPGFSITGSVADHRLRAKASEVRAFAEALAAKVLASGVAAPAGAEALAGSLAGRSFRDARWIDAVAADLVAHAGRCVVVAGERQPAAVHALAQLLNAALGNVGTTVKHVAQPPAPASGSLSDLVAALTAGEVDTLLVLDVNAVHGAPGDLRFAEALGKAKTSVHVGLRRDETGALCTWHLPQAHWLECWGDVLAADGTLALQQPLIAPLFGGVSPLELLARAAGNPAPDGYALVRETLALHGLVTAAPTEPGAAPAAAAVGSPEFEDAWRRWLSDGVVGRVTADVAAPAFAWDGAAPLLAAAAPATEGLELDFVLGASTHDGRFANNAWMQELPDPLTKLTWDNAACLSPATSKRLGVTKGDMVEVGGAGAKLAMAAWVTPGLADDVVVLPLGYGRTASLRVAAGVGWNVNAVRSAASPHFAPGTLSRAAGSHRLACTQQHGTLVEPKTGRERQELVRVVAAEEYAKNPLVVEELEVLDEEHLKSLWVEPNVRDGHQWGMSIDLNACTGCNACAIACQAENNIPVVGKERVLNGREMHWIRLDRYFSGDENDPIAVMQPVPCMQCENAPCEQVCPVAATTHSPDGLNDMAYNRCIGTRYCANNCPFKVRRFNFFNYGLENDVLFQVGEAKEQRAIVDQVVNRNQPPTLIAYQRNPDVSVRFRGVMEKCTYCTQRIQEAKIDAKVHGDGKVRDGAVVTACAQACPTRAIVFGDINDPASEVSRAKAQERSYAMLAELNIKPRTTYLARLKNPNPALA